MVRLYHRDKKGLEGNVTGLEGVPKKLSPGKKSENLERERRIKTRYAGSAKILCVEGNGSRTNDHERGL